MIPGDRMALKAVGIYDTDTDAGVVNERPMPVRETMMLPDTFVIPTSGSERAIYNNWLCYQSNQSAGTSSCLNMACGFLGNVWKKVWHWGIRRYFL